MASFQIPQHQEINPAPFLVVTFPFLFGIMFGDIGHGLLLLSLALWMVLKEQMFRVSTRGSEILSILFEGRYILLLMGLFSIYAGLLYNDIFGQCLNLFGSSWKIQLDLIDDSWALDPRVHFNSTLRGSYVFGVDPAWHPATNKIVFMNSLKMKLSIVVGVAHMFFGLSLSLLNLLHIRRFSAVFCEFVPQFLFLTSIFGYLVLLIFLKWVLYGVDESSKAPSILLTFIDMLMLRSSPPFMFAFQAQIQTFLVVLAVICVPWMWLAPVFYACFSRKNGAQEPGLGEVFMHHSIHTIEYVLGSVSHTASYLRLWALSLAHAQLSEVLWIMVLQPGFQIGGKVSGLALWLIFPVWAVLTVAVLVVMEGLSAFLHTLRLHWVEFQSKFYAGQGTKFRPFAFA